MRHFIHKGFPACNIAFTIDGHFARVHYRVKMPGKGFGKECDCSSSTTASPKKKKLCTNHQTYWPSYTERFPCIKRSTVSEQHVRCTVCGLDFQINHGGITDVERHVKTNRHVEMAKVSTPSVAKFFSAPHEDLSVIRAEAFFAHFLVEHNLPISASDHAGKLFEKMFPDSSIARKYSSARTKTTAIVKCLAEDNICQAAERLKETPFVIGTDGSQEGGVKYFPIVVRYTTSDGKLETAEEQWANIGKIKDCTGSFRFKLLSSVMLSILLIPVSNASCERMFSCARKNLTEFRGSMGRDTTEALLILKSCEGICYNASMDNKLLQKCRSATAASLKQ